jgi:hypothetical protein
MISVGQAQRVLALMTLCATLAITIWLLRQQSWQVGWISGIIGVRINSWFSGEQHASELVGASTVLGGDFDGCIAG